MPTATNHDRVSRIGTWKGGQPTLTLLPRTAPDSSRRFGLRAETPARRRMRVVRFPPAERATGPQHIRAVRRGIAACAIAHTESLARLPVNVFCGIGGIS